jgi:signal transduction histidine kinase
VSTTARRSGNPKIRKVVAAANIDIVVPTAALSPAEPERDLAEALKRKLARLALDVHDGPMQNLAVIGINLGDLRRSLASSLDDSEHAQIDAGMERLGAELGRVESELRALIAALEDDGATVVPLSDAIAREIVEFERRSAASVELNVIGDVRTETDSQRIALQSVTREALSNVAKHAGAHNVRITLTGVDDVVTLEIEDDGRGFRVGSKSSKARIGLAGMRKRVEMLGGEFGVTSRPGGPTRVTATLQAWRPHGR